AAAEAAGGRTQSFGAGGRALWPAPGWPQTKKGGQDRGEGDRRGGEGPQGGEEKRRGGKGAAGRAGVRAVVSALLGRVAGRQVEGDGGRGAGVVGQGGGRVGVHAVGAAGVRARDQRDGGISAGVHGTVLPLESKVQGLRDHIKGHAAA